MLAVSTSQKNDAWFLDTSCVSHMTGYKHIFVDMDKLVSSQAKTGNRVFVNAEGKGIIGIQIKNE